MAQQHVFEGTWEEVSLHAEKLKGQRVQLMVLPPVEGVRPSPSAESQVRKPLKGLVRFAGRIGGTEEVMREKQRDIAREDGTPH